MGLNCQTTLELYKAVTPVTIELYREVTICIQRTVNVKFDCCSRYTITPTMSCVLASKDLISIEIILHISLVRCRKRLLNQFSKIPVPARNSAQLRNYHVQSLINILNIMCSD